MTRKGYLMINKNVVVVVIVVIVLLSVFFIGAAMSLSTEPPAKHKGSSLHLCMHGNYSTCCSYRSAYSSCYYTLCNSGPDTKYVESKYTCFN